MTVRNPRYRVCSVCGNRWNVSVLDPNVKKYVCPKCEWQMKGKQRRNEHEGQQDREIPRE